MNNNEVHILLHTTQTRYTHHQLLKSHTTSIYHRFMCWINLYNIFRMHRSIFKGNNCFVSMFY